MEREGVARVDAATALKMAAMRAAGAALALAPTLAEAAR